MMGGIIFPFTYIALREQLGANVSFMEKDLFTGRERIWATLFAYVRSHPRTLYWGTGKVKELFWHSYFDMHNSYLAVFVQYGLIASAFFWLLLLLVLFQKYNKMRAAFQKRDKMRALFPQDAEPRAVASVSKLIEMDINAIVFILFSLCDSYTVVYYQYFPMLVYLAYGYGVVARKGSAHDT